MEAGSAESQQPCPPAIVTPAPSLPRASLAVRRAAQLPKLKDLTVRPRDSMDEAPSAGPYPDLSERDLDLDYGDCDPSFAQELSELYSYSELPEFPTQPSRLPPLLPALWRTREGLVGRE